MNKSCRVLGGTNFNHKNFKGTRVHPSCYATSRQIILCFNKKRIAVLIHHLPFHKTFYEHVFKYQELIETHSFELQIIIFK